MNQNSAFKILKSWDINPNLLISRLSRPPAAVAGEGRIRRGGEAQAPAAVQRALRTLQGAEPGVDTAKQRVSGWWTQPQPKNMV